MVNFYKKIKWMKKILKILKKLINSNKNIISGLKLEMDL